MQSQTELIHLQWGDEQLATANPPLWRASTILYQDLAEMEARERAVQTDADVLYYGRKGTPPVFMLQDAITRLEGGHRSLVFPSGLAACTAALMATLKAGDHLLITDSAYGPTRQAAQQLLPRWGVEVTFFAPTLPADALAALFKPNTKLVFLESPGSHTFEVQDIPAIAAVAHARGARVAVDNTWATPLYCQPLQLGADLVIHAATKYIGGHSDATIGTVTANRDAWPDLKRYTWGMGLTAGAEEVYAALRGLRTLATRMAAHDAAGRKVAAWLAARPEVEAVLHPALPQAPGHDLWQRDFSGAASLFAVVFKPVTEERFRAAVDALQLFKLGFSWGGFESLVVPIAPAKYRDCTPWPYSGPAVRLHIGLEAVDDLLADLEQAFVRLQ